MPGFYTHYLFGAMSYNQLTDHHLRTVIANHKSVYTYGLQGPDFLFYFLPSYILHSGNLGSIMHERRTGEFLQHLLKARNSFQHEDEQSIAEAYILGFLGHYILDSVAHPYIYDRSGYVFKRDQSYYSRHIELETEIDSDLLAYYKHRKPSQFAQHRLLTLRPKEKQVISALLSEALQKTYPRAFLQKPVINSALWFMRIGTRLFHDKYRVKKPVVRKVEDFFFHYYPISFMIPTDKPSDFIDPTNVLHDSWKNPWAPEMKSTENFYEVFERAQKEYLILVHLTAPLFTTSKNSFDNAAFTAWKKQAGNKSYHSGLPCEL